MKIMYNNNENNNNNKVMKIIMKIWNNENMKMKIMK